MTRYLVTSALPYINGVKHLGNLIGSMLPADVYSRYLRQRGREVLFICGTDEHGTPAELAAKEAGLPVAEYCGLQHRIQKNLYEGFELSFDHFGRTSSPHNHSLTQQFAETLDAHGFLEEREILQLYSVLDGRFLPDRYVIGTCPFCGYQAARGDQCESCTRLLDPIDLINPRSAISGSRDLEVRSSRHLFLLQSTLASKIGDWIKHHEKDWPALVTSIARKWLKEGLRDRCITRDLTWGVPVNRPGFEGKVFYVWFDAPIGYLAATWEWSERAGRDWKSWWYDAKDVKYLQFMAKDNIPFHTLSFPATLMGTMEPWKLVDYIKGFNWLTYYGGKFSTSQRRGIFMDDALALLPCDYWRYYLLANAPESSDSDFSWHLFAATVGKDLADTLGNFVNRSFALLDRHFDSRLPTIEAPTDLELDLERNLSLCIERFSGHMEYLEFRKATQALRDLWTLGNVYLDRAQPWKLIKTDREGTARVLQTAMSLIRIYAVVSRPVIPQTSQTLLRCLSEETEKGWLDGDLRKEIVWTGQGRRLQSPGVLFQKLDDERVEQLEAKFGGRE